MVDELRLDVQLPEDVPAWLARFRQWVDFKVQLYETDANGHMSQLTYFAYQEAAFSEYCARLGRTDLVASQSPLSLFMGEQYCRFIAEVGYGQALRVGVRCAKLGRSSLSFEYAFQDASGGLVAAGANRIVLVDLGRRRPVPVPEDLRAAIARLEAA